MKKDTWKLVAILLGIVFAASYFGYIKLMPTAPSEEGEPPTLPESKQYEAAAITFGLKNGITDGSVSTGTLDHVSFSVAIDGVIDFLTTWEQFGDIDAATENTALTYNYGDTVVMHATSDLDTSSGEEHYAGWFYATLIPGKSVRKLTPDILTATQTSPTYKYKISGEGVPTGFKVQYIAGTTPYWGVGLLDIYPRVAEAQMDMSLIYKATTLASVTDGSSWVDDPGEQTANATLDTDDEFLEFRLDIDTANLAYGLTQYSVTAMGKFEERAPFIIFNTNMTALGVDKMTQYGWSKMSDTRATSSVTFYKKLDAVIPQKSQKGSALVKIPIDASAAAASTSYTANVWIMEMQVPAHVAIASVTESLPTVYGMVKEYGLDTLMTTTQGYTIASGVGDDQQLYSRITTAA